MNVNSHFLIQWFISAWMVKFVFIMSPMHVKFSALKSNHYIKQCVPGLPSLPYIGKNNSFPIQQLIPLILNLFLSFCAVCNLKLTNLPSTTAWLLTMMKAFGFDDLAYDLTLWVKSKARSSHFQGLCYCSRTILICSGGKKYSLNINIDKHILFCQSELCCDSYPTFSFESKKQSSVL